MPTFHSVCCLLFLKHSWVLWGGHTLLFISVFLALALRFDLAFLCWIIFHFFQLLSLQTVVCIIEKAPRFMEDKVCLFCFPGYFFGWFGGENRAKRSFYHLESASVSLCFTYIFHLFVTSTQYFSHLNIFCSPYEAWSVDPLCSYMSLERLFPCVCLINFYLFRRALFCSLRRINFLLHSPKIYIDIPSPISCNVFVLLLIIFR